MGVSHSRLTMAANGDLKVFSNPRGRPDKETVKILKCPKKMRKELEDMRDKILEWAQYGRVYEKVNENFAFLGHN